MKIDRNLKKGMEGDDVYRLQEELKKLGYDPRLADGKFGDKTEEAVNGPRTEIDACALTCPRP